MRRIDRMGCCGRCVGMRAFDLRPQIGRCVLSIAQDTRVCRSSHRVQRTGVACFGFRCCRLLRARCLCSTRTASAQTTTRCKARSCSAHFCSGYLRAVDTTVTSKHHRPSMHAPARLCLCMCVRVAVFAILGRGFRWNRDAALVCCFVSEWPHLPWLPGLFCVVAIALVGSDGQC